MKIRWFEVLVLALTVLTALVFLTNYLATVQDGDITVTVWRGGAYTQSEEVQTESNRDRIAGP